MDSKKFFLIALISLISIFSFVSAASAEQSIQTILDTRYGPGNWVENNIDEISFVPGTYALLTIVVDAHQADWTDPTGWYEVDSGSTHTLFNVPQAGQSTTFTPGEQFGLYINSALGRFCSEMSRNPGLLKHARVFTITSGTNTYVVAFEDQSLGDADYNDVVVELKGEVSLIPEFTTIALPVAGILGLFLVFNHRKRKQG